MTNLSDFIVRLENIEPDATTPDELLAIQCCQLAIKSIEAGSYGVAALLVDPADVIVSEGRNQVYEDGFLSSAHAEMVCLDHFENLHSRRSTSANIPWKANQLTLFVSLEPCPMCLSRILLSGIGRVKYLVADKEGGMVDRLSKLPAAFRNLASVQTYQRAKVSKELGQLASDLATFDANKFRSLWREKTGHTK